NRVNTESGTPYRYMFLGSAQIACLMALRLSGLQNVPCRPDKAFTPPSDNAVINLRITLPSSPSAQQRAKDH
ncbi:hypothetical protein, partial [Escherichia coli]|uniref:hypothetical protein n=1 Tax=Escherichia coli TaxID=562 RepID=UPI003D2EF741